MERENVYDQKVLAHFWVTVCDVARLKMTVCLPSRGSCLWMASEAFVLVLAIFIN
jgi:hypothetical protein